MSELDKFKRRTIRSVARLLLKEKQPPEVLWEQMKKETGTDCRTLWERMRALCVKKLNRMIAVDDRSASLPSIARLSLTDWLLVDLVLVHEEIDVIAIDQSENREHPALIELFNLVQRFNIEGRSGEPLAEAWAAATVFYNRQGRQCSPMLLQRRWYQLKKLTRCRFYKFWFSYRGNTRLLEEARKSMPTRLQMAIAKRYPDVITKEYPDWEELIVKRFVIMPEEFETKMRMPNLPKPCNSNAPDLLVVEPVIETIDLRVESEPEDHDDDEMEDASDPEKSNDATDITQPGTLEEAPVTEKEIPVNDEPLGVQVKTEPIEEDGLSNVQLISATHVPEVEIPDELSDENHDVAAPSEAISEDNSPDDEGDVIVLPTGEQMPIVNVVESGTKTPRISASCDGETINDSDEAIDDIIKVKAYEFCRKKNEVPTENDTIDDLIKDKVETYLKTPKELLSCGDKKPDDSIIDSKNKAEIAAIDLMADLNFVDDGIEFVDDGVEFVEEDNAQNIQSTTKISSDKENVPSADQMEEVTEVNAKFDIKLLMYPVVYTTKLDEMKIFKNKEIDSVQCARDIELAVLESKPVSDKSINVTTKQESVISYAENTADNDDLFTNQEETDDEDIDEEAIVSPNSYMLKKPRTRTYDPIKLCKNPDFNTKLKRLTIGFLSSTRNRQLLNACIPVTIDLSKAFESKLVDSTLYLKNSGTAHTAVNHEVIEKQASSVVPTAMPVQSLIDNSKVDIQHLISHQSSAAASMISERTKVINLPDIDKVRRINQQLLTAQVPPLRVYAGNSRVVDKSPQEANPTFSTVSNIEHVEPITEATSIENKLPKIKVEGEKSADSSLLPETLPSAKEKLLKIINQAKISTKEALDKIDDVTKPKDFPMPIVIKAVKNNIPSDMPTRKHHFQPRVPLAWAPRQQPIKNNIDDFGLLTSDTLNKMLHLLMSGANAGNGCKCCGIKKAKKKKGRPQSENKQKYSDSTNAVHDAAVQVANKGEGIKASEDTGKKPQTQKEIPVSKVVKTRYCCWANQKLNNRKRISRHLCPPDPCKCCCAEILVKKIKTDEAKRILQEDTMAAKSIVELSDDEDDIKARESIESVVQQSVQLTDESNINSGQEKIPYLPAVSVVETTPVVSTDPAVSSANPVTPSINVEVVAPSVSKVTIDLGITPSEIKETPTTPPKPFIKIRAAPTASLMPNRAFLNRRRVTKHVINPTPHISVNRTPTPRTQMQSQVNRQGHWASCSCRPALSQDTRKYIVIDASKNCEIHPTPNVPIQVSLEDTEVDKFKNCARFPTPIAPKQISPQKRDILDQNQETPNQKQEKVLYLQSKHLAKSPSESPIFLGKNKILLTTVKFPRKNEEVVPPTDVHQQPKVIPTLPLPAGVQLVLMPSGNVTYTLDPGVELDEAQLAALPTILAAVQEQLNASGVTSTTTVTEPQVNAEEDTQRVSAVNAPETSDNTKSLQSNVTSDSAENTFAERNNITDVTDPAPQVSLETNEIFQDTDFDSDSTKTDASMEQNTSTNTSSMEKGTGSYLEVEPAVNLETTTAPTLENATACNLETDTVLIPENEAVSITGDTVNKEPDDTDANKDITEPIASAQKTADVDKSRNEEPQENKSTAEREKTPGDKESSKKNLLSDLMEMSGISAEDATALEPPATELPIIEQEQRTASIIVNDASRNLPELSPVTSFAELKYACQQNGKFFKLDFETGVIVPINVCIKKNPKTKTTPTKVKELIDLTDDVESVDVESPEQQDIMNKSFEDIQPGSSVLKEPVEYLFNGKTVNVSNIVKPVKLFKACRPTAPRVLKRVGPSILKKVHVYESLIKRTHVEKRKQSLKNNNAKIEAKIDLVDSDEPMEEEYLVDSSDDDASENRVEPAQMIVEALDSLNNYTQSDDSSDDEPLAKKSKRLKDVDDQDENVKETNIFDEIPDVADPTSNTDKDLLLVKEKAVTSGIIDEAPVRPSSVTLDLDTTNSKNNTTQNSNSDEPPAKVRKVLASDTVNTEGTVEDNNLSDDIDESEDEDSDKIPPELTFFSDHSQGGDDDCILGF